MQHEQSFTIQVHTNKYNYSDVKCPVVVLFGPLFPDFEVSVSAAAPILLLHAFTFRKILSNSLFFGLYIVIAVERTQKGLCLLCTVAPGFFCTPCLPLTVAAENHILSNKRCAMQPINWLQMDESNSFLILHIYLAHKVQTTMEKGWTIRPTFISPETGCFYKKET